MSTFDIRLFGAIEIRHKGVQLTQFRSQKALTLLAYLINHDRPIMREFLAGLIWPEREQSLALGLLRRTLYDLSNKLPGCLLIDRRTVQFRPMVSVSIDVHAFAMLAAQDNPAAWAQAIMLYQAPFGEGIYLNDAPELENWLLREQEQWQQHVAHLLNRLIVRHKAEGAYDAALHYARRLVELEPWREETHCQIMWLLAHTGQTGAALAQYRRCRQALWTELAVEPTATTQALYANIQAMPRLAGTI